ncbi:hypothetical protein ABBQ38_010830 [Trebouxia sp. C0009 RCD-2024]
MAHSALAQSTLLKSISVGTGSLHKTTTLSKHGSVSTPTKVVRAISGFAPRHTKHASLDSAIDLSFRLYKHESGSLSRVSLNDQLLEKAFSIQNDTIWESVQSPKIGAINKSQQLADLLDLPTDNMTEDPATPKGEQTAYNGVYVLQQPKEEGPKKSRFGTRDQGASDTKEYRQFVQHDGKDVSAWHDIPLQNEDGTFNFVCEIPKETSAKMEVATKEASNPLKQDIKKDKLRFYPYNIHWNYGMLPQTWEDPELKSEELGGIAGDNDPVDVVEIGSVQCQQGGVYKVKPLGAYAMIDDGELDWKIVCIRTDDPLADVLNDIEDVEREMPGELERVMIWFRDYKIPDGKPANAYGYDARPLNSDFAKMVIGETHEHYNKLKEGKRENNGSLALS